MFIVYTQLTVQEGSMHDASPDLLISAVGGHVTGRGGSWFSGMQDLLAAVATTYWEV
jgi:hypothetical protein